MMHWTVRASDVRGRYRIIGAVVVVTLTFGCAKRPPNLAPDVVPIWNANEAVVALGTFGQSVIGLNAIEVCPPPDPSIGGIIPCRKLVSDDNTRIVGRFLTAAIATIKVSPDGWRVTALTALDQISAQLDATGLEKLRTYINAARAILRAIL